MGRLPTLQRADLRADQAAVWDAVTGGPRADAHRRSGGLVADDGGLIGPFNAWLHSPALGGPAAELGAAVRFRSTLDRQLLELVILTVATHWRCEFELWSHRTLARDAGVPDEVIDAVAVGAAPDSIPAPELQRRCVAATRQLLETGFLDGSTYDTLRHALGDSAMVELVTTIGYYTLVAFNLNAFQVEVPAPPEG